MGNNLVFTPPTVAYNCDNGFDTSSWTLNNPNTVNMNWQYVFLNPSQGGTVDFPARAGLWPVCPTNQMLCFSDIFQATPGDNDFEAHELMTAMFSADCGPTPETGCYLEIDYPITTPFNRCVADSVDPPLGFP